MRGMRNCKRKETLMLKETSKVRPPAFIHDGSSLRDSDSIDDPQNSMIENHPMITLCQNRGNETTVRETEDREGYTTREMNIIQN
ncbi:hypothetical protein L596_013416 [Steinernema carpocapsae]|uniref:Uncharacterized protein n=1 Tax=Steinernema carpocapsae TaxID=34508 RepID=A0A4U5P029_STECR|nr:hypothetical protein L596_013416 [Steinernema carpocapsae]